MKNIILGLLIVFMLSQPCNAVEPEELLTINNTLWQSNFGNPYLGEFKIGFSGNSIFINNAEIYGSSYYFESYEYSITDLVVICFFNAYHSFPHDLTEYYFSGFVFPMLGFGFVEYQTDTMASDFGIITKINDNWTPPTELICEEIPEELLPLLGYWNLEGLRFYEHIMFDSCKIATLNDVVYTTIYGEERKDGESHYTLRKYYGMLTEKFEDAEEWGLQYKYFVLLDENEYEDNYETYWRQYQFYFNFIDDSHIEGSYGSINSIGYGIGGSFEGELE